MMVAYSLATAFLVAGALAYPLSAQTQAAPHELKTKPAQRRTGLECAYYDKETKPHAGTCGRDSKHSLYVCRSDDDPSLSQVQAACEYRVLSAEKARGGEAH